MNFKQDIEQKVFQYLSSRCVGRSNSIKANMLAEIFHSNIREVNEAVRSLRKQGRLIGSSKQPPFGYFIPSTDNEIKDYLNSFKSELFDMLSTFNKQKRAVNAHFSNRNYDDLFPVGNLS